jgi:integrase/recombinase XerD
MDSRLMYVKSTRVEISLKNRLSFIVAAIFDNRERIAELPFLFAIHLVNSTLYSPNTAPTYLSAINLFIRHVIENEETNGFSIDEILLSVNSFQVNHFLSGMRKANKSDNYICTCDAALKTFYQWLEVNNFLHQSILQNFGSPYKNNRAKALRPNHQIVRHIDSYELITFINHGFATEHLRCALHFMFDTGVRISELVRFKVGDILGVKNEVAQSEFIKIGLISSKGRGGTSSKGHIYVSRVVFDRIKNLIVKSGNLDFSKPLFTLKSGIPIKASTLQQYLNRASKRLLRDRVIDKQITAHMFRHGTAFSLLKFSKGNPDIETLIYIKQILRHKSILSIENYISINFIDIRAGREVDLSKGIHSRLLEAKFIFDNTITLTK